MLDNQRVYDARCLVQHQSKDVQKQDCKRNPSSLKRIQIRYGSFFDYQRLEGSLIKHLYLFALIAITTMMIEGKISIGNQSFFNEL